MDLSDPSGSQDGEMAATPSMTSDVPSQVRDSDVPDGNNTVNSAVSTVEVIVLETPETPQQSQDLFSTWSQDRQNLMDRVKDLVSKGEISQAAFVEFQRANPIPGDGQLKDLTAAEVEDFQDHWNESFTNWVSSQLEDEEQRFPAAESLQSVHSSDKSSDKSSPASVSDAGLSSHVAVEAESDMEE